MTNFPPHDSLPSSKFLYNIIITDSGSFSNHKIIKQLTSPQITGNRITSKEMSFYLPLSKMSYESRQPCLYYVSSFCDSTHDCCSNPDQFSPYTSSPDVSLCSSQSQLPLPPPQPPPLHPYSSMSHLCIIINLTLMGYARPRKFLFIHFTHTVAYNQSPIWITLQKLKF